MRTTFISICALLCVAVTLSAQWTPPTPAGSVTGPIYYNGGNVGIGVNPPLSLLHVNGVTRSEDRVEVRKGGSDTIAAGSGFFLGDVQGDYAGMQLSAANSLDFSLTTTAGVWSRVATMTRAGNMGIGTTAPDAQLQVVGAGHFTGSLTVDGNIAAKYQDIAEWVSTPESLAPGTVVVVDPAGHNAVSSSTSAYQTSVAGVVSAQPGLILGVAGESKAKVATTGRVKVRVDAGRGPIAPGDLLVTSDEAGTAMRSEAIEVGGVKIHRPGTILGKALEALAAGKGEILVLLTLQ